MLLLKVFIKNKFKSYGYLQKKANAIICYLQKTSNTSLLLSTEESKCIICVKVQANTQVLIHVLFNLLQKLILKP